MNSNSDYLRFQSITRLNNLPIVETSWNLAGKMYERIKKSNSLINWTLDTAEVSFHTVLEIALPSTVAVLGESINTIDKLLCKSLDIVEDKIPNIRLPPQMIYRQTKEYVNSTFVRPVLKRADSVKQIGNSVLESKYTTFAAGKLESALNLSDKYVDKYLPDAADQIFDEKNKVKNDDQSAVPAVQTMHHAYRFSKKLTRRFTKRTLAEAKALKVRSQESIHVLLYVAELIATNPKQAIQEVRQLWLTLSEDEPENQARPENLEQLIVMLTRESARRIVHLVNFTRSFVSHLPINISRGVQLSSQQLQVFLDHLIKNIHLDELTNAVTTTTTSSSRKMNLILQEFGNMAHIVLEKFALSLAGQSDPKISRSVSRSPKNNRPHQHENKNYRHASNFNKLHSNENRINHRHSNSVVNNGA